MLGTGYGKSKATMIIFKESCGQGEGPLVANEYLASIRLFSSAS